MKQYNSDGLLDYNYTWTNVGAGTYQIWAGVQSNLGSISKKEAITVTGDDEQPQPPPPPPPQLSLLLTRHYVYDANQQLCKVIEPETGATVYTYDGAGNLAWSASGLNLADPGNCNRNEAYASSRVVLRAYDSRNRLTDLSFPDGVGDQQWLYARDGLPEQVSTVNGSDGFRDTIINTYSYNRRRLLTRETQELSGSTNAIDYGYSANGDLSRLSYPSGRAVDYAPNALGQPTRAGGYATGVRYHANGAIASFTYGNGLTHNMTQNARQLPGRSTDSGGVLDHAYTYDANGNVTIIDDIARGATYRRTMQYDGLDRLTQAGSPNFGGDGVWQYTYDDLDNLHSAKLGGVQDHTYWYDAANRLLNIKTDTGATVVGLGYDMQGNLTQKNGQRFQFDYGNRLRRSGSNPAFDSRYWYDAYGRRAWHGSENGDPRWDGTSSQYSQAGQLLARTQMRDGRPTSNEYVYLGDSLIAIAEPYDDAMGGTEKYQHTDALGSPVAVTAGNSGARSPLPPRQKPCSAIDTNGECLDGGGSGGVIVVERTDYQPYGAPIGKIVDGVGYTGHVMDGGTRLTYMQQRYYDPQVGSFLSADPVTAYSSPVAAFNRYWYANNNPYKFIDPDGRATCADTACKTSTVDGVVPRSNPQPPPVNGLAGLPKAIEQKASEGYATTVTFQNDDPNGTSPNQPVATSTANMVESAISKSGVQSVNINSTTGGTHGARSAHYSGRAVDINRVDGQKVNAGNAGAARIQEAARQGGSVRENFGPRIMEKTLAPGAVPRAVTNQSLINAHQNHVHLSGQL